MGQWLVQQAAGGGYGFIIEPGKATSAARPKAGARGGVLSLVREIVGWE